MAGGHDDMISLQGGSFVPVPLASIVDPATGRIAMRLVDTDSARYQIARRYMIRLRPDDFENPEQLSRLAAVVGVDAAEFGRQFKRAAYDGTGQSDESQITRR
jgi:6-phosphofructokinase 1